jgi:hypothetical protein
MALLRIPAARRDARTVNANELLAARQVSGGVGRHFCLACCAVVVLSACAGPGSGHSGTAPPATDLSADSLMVSVEEMRRITGDNDLNSLPAFDLHQPRRDDDLDTPIPCRVVYDQKATFGNGWTQFRSVDYRDPGEGNDMIRDVGQAVAIYPDENAARTVFDRLASELTACSALHVKNYRFTVDKQDPLTVVLDYSRILQKIIRVKASALIFVDVNFPQSEPIARTILQVITDRIE